MRIFHGWCRSSARLDGKTAVVTGCNIGIGKSTVFDFVKRGARVVMACRDVGKAAEAAEDIRKQTSGQQGLGEMVVVKLDLASLKSVEECAVHILQTEQRINILVNNAGVLMGYPKSFTEDGFEWHFGVNHLGPFFFTCLLLPRILRSVPARIVNLSSISHWGSFINFDDINMDRIFQPFMAYGRSKLCNILFSNELGRRLEGTGVTTYAVHPGIIRTEIWRNEESISSSIYWICKNILRISKSCECGAQTTIYCAVEESLWKETGHYYSDCARDFMSCTARSSYLARRLWEESIKYVGIQKWNPFTAPDTSYVRPASRQETKEPKNNVTLTGHFGEDIVLDLPNYYE